MYFSISSSSNQVKSALVLLVRFIRTKALTLLRGKTRSQKHGMIFSVTRPAFATPKRKRRLKWRLLQRQLPRTSTEGHSRDTTRTMPTVRGVRARIIGSPALRSISKRSMSHRFPVCCLFVPVAGMDACILDAVSPRALPGGLGSYDSH